LRGSQENWFFIFLLTSKEGLKWLKALNRGVTLAEQRFKGGSLRKAPQSPQLLLKVEETRSDKWQVENGKTSSRESESRGFKEFWRFLEV
jgi:hypothetical protein